jgi:DNA-binding XRE family transcriptional regulator
MNPLPAILKAWRRSNGHTQKLAALILGVPLRTYQGWEAGREPEHVKLVCLAIRGLEFVSVEDVEDA